ncbi:MAG: TraB/GumN family protein, partial [Kofleriaceae bacterium]|nr:TraB/GumN family protein [Kofleriaceae bacterium]
DRADTFVAEANEMPAGLDVRTVASVRPLFFLPQAASLERLIGSENFDRLVDDLDATPETVRELKPWLALMMLGRAAYEFAGPSINEALVEQARGRTMSLVFLETWSDQLRYLDAAITPRKLAAAIHDFDRMGCAIEQRVAAYRAGDDAKFSNEIASPDEPIAARIVSWTARLHEVLYAGSRSFAVLGVGQLVGPYGVLVRLEALGYRVERL